MPATPRRLIIACFMVMLVVFVACGSHDSEKLANSTAPILLFDGAGVSPNDVAAIETILDNNRLGYTTVNSSGLNKLGLSELEARRLLIVPGGDFIVMGNKLTPSTAPRIRRAVQHGLNYLGICAGSFLAGNSAYYNGFNLASGISFGFYPIEKQGIRKAVVTITSPGAGQLDQYWEDGPQLSRWGKAVAKYPEGTPAVAEGKCGNGFVMLAGIHAEAPAGWRGGMKFDTPVSADNAYASMLIRSALTGIALPHY